MNIIFLVGSVAFLIIYVVGGHFYDLYMFNHEVYDYFRGNKNELTEDLKADFKIGSKKMLINTILTATAPLIVVLSCANVAIPITGTPSAIAKIIFLVFAAAVLIVVKPAMLYGEFSNDICHFNIISNLPKILFTIFVLGFLSFLWVFFLVML